MLKQIADVNESLLSKIQSANGFFGVAKTIAWCIVPVVITWAIIAFYRSLTSDENTDKRILTEEERADVYGEKNESDTDIQPTSEKLNAVLQSIKDDLD